MYKKIFVLGSALLCTTQHHAGEIYTSPHQLTPSDRAGAPKAACKKDEDDALANHALTTLAKAMAECVKAAQEENNPTAVLQVFGTAVAGIFDIVATALRSGRLSPHADEEEIIIYLETLGTDFQKKLKNMLIEQGDVIRAMLSK